MVMADDWDLHAVVRGCATVTSSTAAATSTAVTIPTCSGSSTTGSCTVSSSSGGFVHPMYPIIEPKVLSSSIAQMQELCKPNYFFPKSHLVLPNSFQVQAASFSSSSSSPLSYSSSSAPKSAESQTQQKNHLSSNKHSHAGSHTTPRSKRRKNQLKKVCHIPAEALSSDIWSWRKYGQKPIKGSPYPRGYYRCSSSKVCPARKQVERNRSDPTMFIVTYTAEHNHPAPTHRNSLAGSTRHKPAAAVGDSDKASAKPISPPTSGVEEELASQGTTTRSESKEEEENELGLSDMELSDDFFEGLDELTGSPAPPHAAIGDSFADPFSPSIEFLGWGG